MGKITDRVRRSWHFTRSSLVLLAFSVVPVVGPIVAYVGQVICVLFPQSNQCTYFFFKKKLTPIWRWKDYSGCRQTRLESAQCIYMR